MFLCIYTKAVAAKRKCALEMPGVYGSKCMHLFFEDGTDDGHSFSTNKCTISRFLFFDETGDHGVRYRSRGKLEVVVRLSQAQSEGRGLCGHVQDYDISRRRTNHRRPLSSKHRRKSVGGVAIYLIFRVSAPIYPSCWVLRRRPDRE